VCGAGYLPPHSLQVPRTNLSHLELCHITPMVNCRTTTRRVRPPADKPKSPHLLWETGDPGCDVKERQPTRSPPEIVVRLSYV